MQQTSDLNVAQTIALDTPETLKKEIEMTETANQNVVKARETIKKILDRQDSRLLCVVGPCSIHDEKAALEYASLLKRLATQVEDQIFVVMRVYFEKPRTTVGWKGLINDPYLDDSFKIGEGLKKARKLLLQINEMGLPAGTEMLDPIVPQYIADLISWSAIGARTTESQTHREMASGLSMPVGFKNGTNGSLEVAVNAMKSALQPHAFLGIDESGKIAIIRTAGNKYGHVVLRGGSGGPNYDEASVQQAKLELEKNNLAPLIMVDCSHANSEKSPEKQERVLKEVTRQIAQGQKALIGVMIESHLHLGNQNLKPGMRLNDLAYGVSITDKCLDWENTERMILEAYTQLRQAQS